MADGKITIDTSLDSSGIEKGISQIEGTIKKGFGKSISYADKQISGLKSSLSGLAKVAGTAFAAIGLVQFGKQAIELGSSVSEVQNVVDTAFGDMAYKAEQFADSAIQNFGMSELAAKKTSSTYMAMARGMGVAMDAASDMSIELAGLSGDVASFYNITQEEAAYKLQSVFTGETESLKELGVVMTQTNLQQYAMANGMNSNIQSMTQAEQVALRYAYVTEQLSLASGDFVKTQGSWANQTRILSMQWQQFMSVIGQSLIQVLTPVLQFLNAFVAQLVQWATTVNQIISSLFGGSVTASAGSAQTAMAGAASAADDFSSASMGAADSTESAAAAQDDLASSAADANKELQKQTASFDEMNILQSKASSASGGSGGGSGTGGGGIGGGIGKFDIPEAIDYKAVTNDMAQKFIDAWKAISDGFVEWFVNPIKENLYKFKEPIQLFKSLFENIGAKIVEWTAPLSEWAQTDLKQNVASAISLVSTLLSDFGIIAATVSTTVWNSMVPVIDWIVYEGLPMLSEMFDESCETVEQFGDAVTDVILTIWKDVFDPAFTFISKIVTDTFGIVKELWDKYGATTFENIRKTIETVKKLFYDAWNVIVKPIFDNIFQVLIELWDNHLKPLVENIGEFVAALVNAGMDIYNKFIAPVVSWFIKTFGPPIRNTFNAIINSVGAMLGNIIDAASGIINAIKGIYQFVSGVFTGNWKKAWEGVKNIFSGVWKSLTSIAKVPLNGIIKMMNLVINALNTLIGGLNKISFDIPGWVPLLGGKKFGINIPKIPSIPYLAQGAVLPANKPFMAVVGDQKNGTNVEAPLDTIKQALMEVMTQQGAGVIGPITIVLKVGETTLGRAILKSLQDIARQNGGLELDLR